MPDLFLLRKIIVSSKVPPLNAQPSVLRSKNIITNGDRVCPVTQQKCPSLCPTPEIESDGFSEQTGWAGGRVRKCQEGIYFISPFLDKDPDAEACATKIETRYLPVEVYANFPLPPFDRLVRKSKVIGWGNYEKEVAREYKEPLDSHLFFKDVVQNQTQRSLCGPMMTKVTPLLLELAVLPPRDVLADKISPAASRGLGVEKKNMKSQLDFRSGYFIDLRLLRMSKQVRVNSGASTIQDSTPSSELSELSIPYQAPVDYEREFNMLNTAKAFVNVLELGLSFDIERPQQLKFQEKVLKTATRSPLWQEERRYRFNKEVLSALKNDAVTRLLDCLNMTREEFEGSTEVALKEGEMQSDIRGARSAADDAGDAPFLHNVKVELRPLRTLDAIKAGLESDVLYEEVAVTAPELRATVGAVLVISLIAEPDQIQVPEGLSKELLLSLRNYLNDINVSLFSLEAMAEKQQNLVREILASFKLASTLTRALRQNELFNPETELRGTQEECLNKESRFEWAYSLAWGLYQECIKDIFVFARQSSEFIPLWNTLTSYLSDHINKLHLNPTVFENFNGQRLFKKSCCDEHGGENNTEQRAKAIEKEKAEYTYPDLYICSWDHPFDETNFDFTLYYLNGPDLAADPDSFPIVDQREPVPSDLNLQGYDAEQLAKFGGLENLLGVEMLHSYFLDAGVQAGAIPAPERTYLGVLGSTYVANLFSFNYSPTQANQSSGDE